MKLLVAKTNITNDETVRGIQASGDASKSDVLLALNITSLTGTTQLLDVTVRFTAGNQTFAMPVPAAFTQASGVTSEPLLVPNCPQVFDIRLDFTNTITDCDLTVHGERV